MAGLGVIPITSDEIRSLNRIAIHQSGGELGVLSQTILQNCADLITNEFFGLEQQKGLFRKAAALMECISLGHAFLDGNKRTALLAVDEFLDRNGFMFIPDDLTVDVSMKAARGEMSIADLETWLRKCSKPTF
jgi:death-on-curing protein